MEKAIITFASGGQIEADENGSCFIIDDPFSEGVYSDLDTVTIQDDEGTRVLNNAELIECASIDGRYWFTLREIPQEEAEKTQLRADVDYLLLITE